MAVINYSAPPTPGASLREETLNRISSDEYLAWLKSDETELEGKIIEGDIHLTIDVLHKKIIEDCVFEGKIDTSVKDQYYIDFRNCVFKSSINISVFELGHEISFSSCSAKSITVENCESGSIHLRDSQLSKNLNIRFCAETSFIQVCNCIIDGDINLSELKISERSAPEFESVTCKGKFWISSEAAIPLLYIWDGSYNSINAANQVVNLNIQGKARNTVKIGTLGLSSHNLPSTVFIQNATIDHLIMDHISGKETSFELYDVAITTSWDLSYSMPSDLRTSNMSLSNCSVCFDSTLLSNCVFSNISWPNKKRLFSNVYPKKERNKSLREAYRQLKQAMLKDGNNIDALAFYRNELEEYRAFVKGNRDVKWEDKFILFISWIFSDHGQSFARPVVWLLGMHWGLFLVAIGLNYNSFRFTWPNDWNATINVVGSYFYLLNPVHMLPDTTSGGMRILDFFMRLSSGFFIYHIIRASRKFAKV
jgi:hypothetical protein